VSGGGDATLRSGTERDHTEDCAMTHAARGGGNPYSVACTCDELLIADVTLVARANDQDVLRVRMRSGSSLLMSTRHFERLARATHAELGKYELIGGGTGVHWPDLDEDISIRGFVRYGKWEAGVTAEEAMPDIKYLVTEERLRSIANGGPFAFHERVAMARELLRWRAWHEKGVSTAPVAVARK
jgi:hypothetical protein